ncbi:hypothetical protein [Natronobiforma cellulositropha]|uniref:hypothetical protein n=1 Tax=Natronobiforma cellulositropha TaxID=1679076 RepID=UPI0021D584FE|nr:hypothetical protein [Natronobiforma cellulositropha]
MNNKSTNQSIQGEAVDQQEAEAVDDDAGPSRRRIIQGVGSGALLGLGLSSGTVAAVQSDPIDTDQEHIETESLTPREKGQLRGQVLSSSAFKTIRNTARERDFKPRLGDVEAVRVTNTNTDTERLQLKVPCDYVGDEDDGRTRGAVLFGHKSDEEIYARCISQCEGESIYVDECATPVDDRSGAQGEEDVFVFEIPTTNGGD